MKLSFLTSLKASLYRLRYTLIAIVLGLCLAFGGAYGWKKYQYSLSPEYALGKLNQALLTVDMDLLAEMVDFRSLSLDLARHIYAVRPATPRNLPLEQALAPMADQVQLAFIEALGLAKTPDKLPKENPLGPLRFWPADLAIQMQGKLVLQKVQETIAFATVDIKYPRAETTFPLILLLEKKSSWIVTRLANAENLVKLFVKAENALQQQREDAFAEKNREQQERMNGQFAVMSCTAGSFTLSDRRTTMLTLQIQGYNKGSQIIHNMTLSVDIRGKKGQTKRNVNLAARIPPGENLTQNNNADLNPQNAEDALLIDAGPLECQAAPRAMTLSSGEVLHIREKEKNTP